MIKTLIISLFVLQIVTAETIWVKYGWQSLRNGGDARSLALGNAQVAGGRGSAATLWNPANMTFNLQRSLTYAHQNRFSGIVNSDLLSFPIQQVSRNSTGFILIHEGVSKIPDTRNALFDLNGNGILDEDERLDADKIKQFSQHQWAFHLSRTWLWNNIRLGVGVKGLLHFLGDHTGTGFGIDIGFIKPLWEGAQVGVSIQDVTTSWLVWENGTIEIAKPGLSGGLSQQIQVPFIPVIVEFMGDILVNTEGRSLSDDFNLGNLGGNYRLGSELTYKEKIQLRFGRNDRGMFSTGLGLIWSVLELNYAFQFEPEASGLGDSHFLSFSLDPKWLTGLAKSYL